MTVRTKLVYPMPSSSLPTSEAGDAAHTYSKNTYPPNTDSTDATAVDSDDNRDNHDGLELSVHRLKGHDKANNTRARSHARTPHSIVVRIEVHDTGVGIKPRDMIDNRVRFACNDGCLDSC